MVSQCKKSPSLIQLVSHGLATSPQQYATLYGLAPRGEYTLYVDFEDSILTDADAQRERDRQDVRDGFMQKWEYRVKWYHEDEETAKAMCPPTADTGPGFGF